MENFKNIITYKNVKINIEKTKLQKNPYSIPVLYMLLNIRPSPYSKSILRTKIN